jgi:hypothetical protein
MSRGRINSKYLRCLPSVEVLLIRKFKAAIVLFHSFLFKFLNFQQIVRGDSRIKAVIIALRVIMIMVVILGNFIWIVKAKREVSVLIVTDWINTISRI